MTSSLRPSAVAGRFYPQDPELLLADLHSYLSPRGKTFPVLGCVVPHAGYMYSGHVAGAVFGRITVPRQCFILCPNHTGRGAPLAIMSEGTWETPLGAAPIDSELAEKLKHAFPLLSDDSEAHRFEHAIEVELPFLQVLQPYLRFVPIALGTGQFEVLQALGKAIAEVVKAQAEPVLLVASSDMNHYENDLVTRAKDHKAIQQILARNERELFNVVVKEEISMCGIGPAVTMLAATLELGSTTAELIRYATSGDVSGDRNMVVGYAGIVVR